jgi:hypothetical protein
MCFYIKTCVGNFVSSASKLVLLLLMNIVCINDSELTVQQYS